MVNTFDSCFTQSFWLLSLLTALHFTGGDFNCVLTPDMDHSPPKTMPPSKMARATQELCSDLGLYDAWRTINPTQKDLTFLSWPFYFFLALSLFQGLITFFVSRIILERTMTCSINTCALSDHSSISIELLPPYFDPLSRHWRLKPSLLSNPTFLSYLESQWRLFWYLCFNFMGSGQSLSEVCHNLLHCCAKKKYTS